MRNISLFLRLPDWHYSKCPSFVGVPLYFYALGALELGDVPLPLYLACSFAFMFFFLAFSYVANDFSDMEVDKAAGTEKLIIKMPRRLVLAILVTLPLCSVIPALIGFGAGLFTAAVALATFALGFMYSFKPVRFKEKGVWGLLECSVAQRCMPVLMLYPSLRNSRGLLGCVLALFLLTGLRYILVHQVTDAENDIKSGVETFSRRHIAPAKALVYLCFAAELITIGLLVRPFYRHWMWLLIFAAAYGLVFLLSAWAVKSFWAENCFLTFRWLPLEDLFNIYIPFALSVTASVKEGSPAIAIIMGVYLLPALYGKMDLLKNFLRVKLRMENSR
jgi:4-hydroxybenzoate polyprenyltransferase